MDSRSAKKKAVIARIESLEEEIVRAQEYLQSGEHEHWHGFRPLFVSKVRNGRELPPHKDWVRNVFLPRRQKALRRAEKALDRLSRESSRAR